MLVVTMHTQDKRFLLSMAGHAGAGKRGNDIVCAAASILAYTAAEAARQLFRKGKLTAPPKIKLSPGRALVEIYPGHAEAARQMMETVQTGFHLLAARYPDNVKMEEI